MGLIFNLRHLERRNVRLQGELTAEELELTGVDEMAELAEAVRYDLAVERMSQSVLVRGRLASTLSCHCVRCLRPFKQKLEVPDWTVDLPLEGEEQVMVENDCVDLTPYLREDTLLAFPQHPLCEPDCQGLLDREHNLNRAASVKVQDHGGSAAWAELNKLKF